MEVRFKLARIIGIIFTFTAVLSSAYLEYTNAQLPVHVSPLFWTTLIATGLFFNAAGEAGELRSKYSAKVDSLKGLDFAIAAAIIIALIGAVICYAK
ncbi:MAG: hypothetical protein H7249_03840 [Chitinophagaceae bacterium]|nr:hypothetical protein [Oligoflexus sp.]